MLWAEEDFYIIDFEGEPARSIDGAAAEAIAVQGRRRDDALVQLRGICRAVRVTGVATIGIRSAGAVGTHLAVDGHRGVPAWVFRHRPVTRCFIPGPASQRDALLQLFVLDKAFYELNYELNNRPDWVRIPLSERHSFDL